MEQKIFAAIRDIAALGMSILLVEQNARLALQAAQHGYVMESGAITLSGVASELLGSDAVQRAYLGGYALRANPTYMLRYSPHCAVSFRSRLFSIKCSMNAQSLRCIVMPRSRVT